MANSRRLGAINNRGNNIARTPIARNIRNATMVRPAGTEPPGQVALAKCQFFIKENDKPQSRVINTSILVAFAEERAALFSRTLGIDPV